MTPDVRRLFWPALAVYGLLSVGQTAPSLLDSSGVVTWISVLSGLVIAIGSVWGLVRQRRDGVSEIPPFAAYAAVLAAVLSLLSLLGRAG